MNIVSLWTNLNLHRSTALQTVTPSHTLPAPLPTLVLVSPVRLPFSTSCGSKETRNCYTGHRPIAPNYMSHDVLAYSFTQFTQFYAILVAMETQLLCLLARQVSYFAMFKCACSWPQRPRLHIKFTITSTTLVCLNEDFYTNTLVPMKHAA